MEGEWWRIITSMFLHVGILHFIINMFALYYLGMTVEKTFGSIRFLIIYFTSGIGGGLGSFMFSQSVADGASGALFGLFGELLFFTIIYQQLFILIMGVKHLFMLFICLIFMCLVLYI